jgi:flagellar biosynthesis protein FliR
MATLNIPLDAFYGMLLIFLRVAAIVFSAPLFDSGSIPVYFKAALALSVSVLLLPTVSSRVSVIDLSLMELVLGIIAEIGVGIAIGLSAKLLFTGIQLAGQIAGYQMGFAVANVVDPSTSAHIPILGQIYNLTAMLLFLSINAHHMFFSALVDSYTIIPPLSVHVGPQLVEMMMKLASGMFIIAIRVGAPLIVVMLLTTVGFGIVARTVPQIHIFIVAMPLKILLGLVFMIVIAQHMSAFLIDLFASYGRSLFELLQLMAPVG